MDETGAILPFVADELGPNTYVNLMGQYYPARRSDKCKEIDRRPHREELEQAFEIADDLGLVRPAQPAPGFRRGLGSRSSYARVAASTRSRSGSAGSSGRTRSTTGAGGSERSRSSSR